MLRPVMSAQVFVAHVLSNFVFHRFFPWAEPSALCFLFFYIAIINNDH